MARQPVLTMASGLAALAATVGWLVSAHRLRTRTAQLDRVARRAAVDGLTGLWRREGLEEHAPSALASGNLAGLLDLDRFKQINDRYGHAVGDDVLRAIAGRLADELGPSALIARLGGDEFALIAALRWPLARHQLDRLVAALTAPIRTHAGDLAVGVSLGAVWLQHLPSWEPAAPADSQRAAALLSEALAHADIAMYEAKRYQQGWRLYDPVRGPVRPAAAVCPAPRRRYRDHGPAAVVDTPRITTAGNAGSSSPRGAQQPRCTGLGADPP